MVKKAVGRGARAGMGAENKKIAQGPQGSWAEVKDAARPLKVPFFVLLIGGAIWMMLGSNIGPATKA